MNKLGETADSIEEGANKILDGSYLDKDDDGGDGKEENKTADRINGRLNEKKKKQDNEEDDKKTNASSKDSLSSNVLRTQDVKAYGEESGSEGTQEVESQVKDATGVDLSASKGQKESKWQVAAAVGVSVADHAVSTSVGSISTMTGAIQATAENTGNFNTMGTGAAMSFADHANSIAAGVAVSVNKNKAAVQV